MIGETMMKCKYIDPKKIAKLQTEMCLCSSGDCL
jgi:hypothetical protein